MMAQMGYKIIAYLDDFSACCGTKEEATASFEAFINLTSALGLKLAQQKCSPPATSMEWLGYDIDTQELKVSLPTHKLNQVIEDCERWIKTDRASQRMIQSIAGRLIYVANAIPPARKFTARILAALRSMTEGSWISLTEGFKADLKWFVEYSRLSNGFYLFSPVRPTIEIECDSSLAGGGGVSPPFCYAWTYTKKHTQEFQDIHQLEAVNLIVAYQTLGANRNIHPANVVIYTDNMASSCVLSSGRAKDEILAACSRQLWLLAAVHCHEIIIKHKSGTDIPVADALSRMTIDGEKNKLITELVEIGELKFVEPVLNDYVFFASFL